MTVDWETVLADIEQHEADALTHARPSPTVSRSIGRRRATRVAALAGTVGCVLGFAGWESLRSPPAAALGSAAVTLSEPVTINLVNDRALSAFASVPECGSPAPAVRTSFGGIGIVPVLDADVYGHARDLSVGGTLAQRLTATAAGPVGTPVVTAMGVIYVKGGVVVGYSTENADAVFGRLGVDALDPSVAVRVGAPFCEGTSVNLADGLPAGNYQAFPVVRIHASPVVAAWRAVIEGPHAAAGGDAAGGAAAPPAPACRATAGANFAPAITPECVRASGLDVTGLTAAVRYPVDYYTTDLDLTLVGNPVTFSVEQAVDPHQPVVSTPPDGTAWPDTPRCGALYTDLPRTADTPVYLAAGRLTPANPTDAGPVSVTVGVRATRTPATVAFDAPLDVWATAPWKDSTTVRQVVGHGRIDFSRYVVMQLTPQAPSTVATGTLTSFAWCAGVQPAAITRTAITGTVTLGDANGTAAVRTADVG